MRACSATFSSFKHNARLLYSIFWANATVFCLTFQHFSHFFIKACLFAPSSAWLSKTDSAGYQHPQEQSVPAAHSYSNSGVEKYLSAVSGRMVTTVLPFPSFFARLSAAATLVPLEIPHIKPSFAARSFAVCSASLSETI